MRDTMMSLALLAQWNGWHPAGWIAEDMQNDGSTDVDYYVSLATLAEQGCFDLMFLPDTPAARTDHLEAWSRNPLYMNWFEPTTLLSAIAMKTSHIGLTGTASTSFSEPYNIARLFASLDHLSHGRAGWNVVTSGNNYAARNFGFENLPPHAERYARAHEFVEVVKALWDTYDDDAILYNKMTGQYFDVEKFHVLNHEGAHFKLHGALNIARPPQGYPVIIQAGASPAGKELAAETAEVVFNSDETIDEAKVFYDDLKGRMSKFGRDGNELKVLSGFSCIIGSSQWEAEDKYNTLQAMIHPLVGMERIGSDLELDLTGLNPDEPIPLSILPDKANLHTRYFEQIKQLIVTENLTLRQLWKRYSRGNKLVLGTVNDIADNMQEWFEEKACDGFMMCFQQLPSALGEFVTEVIPELQRRKIFRQEYSGKTLREHLGLKNPVSRHYQ